MLFAEYFLLLKKPGYLRQTEHNLGIKSVFLSPLQGSVITEFFPDEWRLLYWNISEYSKCFPFAVVEVQGEIPKDAKEIKIPIHQRNCFTWFKVYFAKTLLWDTDILLCGWILGCPIYNNVWLFYLWISVHQGDNKHTLCFPASTELEAGFHLVLVRPVIDTM